MKVTKKWRKYYIILAVPFFLLPFSSSLPDGLEWVAENLGFAGAASQNVFLKSPMPDYVFPGIAHDGLSMFLSGILGALLVFVLGYGIAYYFVRKTSR